jgi:putative membrane protein
MNHRVKIESFFNEEEKEKIKDTVVEIEKQTIGEIAVVVAGKSDLYMEAEIMGGVLLSGLISFILTLVSSKVWDIPASLWVYIPLSFIFFFPSRLLFRNVPSLKLALINGQKKEQAVRERALYNFYEKGLYKTKKQTGVLFFLSLFERKVWVLADQGIFEKIDQKVLNHFANIVSSGMKEGRACHALCQAVKEIGEVLTRHFPVTPGDTDELPDGVMFDKGSP